MKKITYYGLIACLSFLMFSCGHHHHHGEGHDHHHDGDKTKPVQHLKIADVTSFASAKKIFIDKTAEIKSKTKLDPTELQQIHFITYSLEKAVAYFAENLKGDQQKLAMKIAEVVENVHLASENNRKSDTVKNLSEYYKLAESFLKNL